MKTSYIQSQLARNASLITALLKDAQDSRSLAGLIKNSADYNADQKKELRNSLFTSAEYIGQQVNKLAELQKALKKDLRTHPESIMQRIKKVGVALYRQAFARSDFM